MPAVYHASAALPTPPRDRHRPRFPVFFPGFFRPATDAAGGGGGGESAFLHP